MVEHSITFKNYDFLKVLPGQLWSEDHGPIWIKMDSIFSLSEFEKYTEVHYGDRHSIEVKETAAKIMSILEDAKTNFAVPELHAVG